jgi:DDE domain
MPKPLNASRVKALHSTASSAPGARPVQEQGEEPTPAAESNPTQYSRAQVHANVMEGAKPPDRYKAWNEFAPGCTQSSAPRVINVDKNAAYPKAIAQLKAAGILPEAVELRQVKDLNNLIEQDHRFIKRRVKPGMGFFSFETAWRTRAAATR